jgi:uncharacterized protein YegJ (DUF2314 family)
MELTLKYLLLVFFFTTTAMADNLKYNDSPMTMDTKVATILAPYTQQAKNTLEIFNRKLVEKEGKIFYVIIKLRENELSEQIFVKVSKSENNTYIGKIASQPLGKIKFKFGDPIKVDTKDVIDWSIVKDNGEEEGNLLGKAMDLLQAGKAAFISKMIPKDGKYQSFQVVSVLNPKTKQEIIDIVPKDAIGKVEAYLKENKGDTDAEDDKERFTYTIVQFPDWEIVSK